MIKVIAGLKGSGKTKQMIELVNEAANKEAGQVICIERGRKLTFDINHAARLIDTADYDVRGFQVLRGFITGLYAGNYDISHVFIDSLLKVVRNEDLAEAEKFFEWLDAFGSQNSVSFTVSLSVQPQSLSEGILKYA